jgi:hypothetical protein
MDRRRQKKAQVSRASNAEEKTVGASCHRHPGLDDFAAFVRYSKASRLK